MKLIKCYIDNFGKLSDKEFIFKDGLNEIREDNGSGKSTLAAFIKAMLFGFSDTKSQKLEENERRKFEPWQGGVFGGSLEFEANNSTYRIERRFSKKASDDSVKIFDTGTGKELPKESEEVGRIIFGIDREGFERTVFFSDKIFSEKNENPTIAAKLSDLSGVSFDMPSLKSALELLEEQRKFYHKQSGSGAIDEVSEQRSILEFKYRELEELGKRHEADAIHLSALRKKQAELAELELKARAQKEKNSLSLALRDQYNEKLLKLSQEKEKLENIKTSFPSDIPKDDELDELAMMEREKSSLSEKLSEFESILPQILEEKAMLKNSSEELEKTAELELKLCEKRKLITSKSDPGRASGATRLPIFICASIFLLLLGIILGVLTNPFLYLTASLAVLPMLVYSSKKKREDKKRAADISALDTEIAELEKRSQAIAEKLEFVYTGTDGLSKSISERLERIEGMLKERERILYEHRRLSERLTAQYSQNGAENLSALRSRVSLYKNTEILVSAIEDEISRFKEKYKLEENKTEPQEILPEIDEITEKLKQINAEISVLAGKYSADENELEAIDEISAKIDELRSCEQKYKESFETVKLTKKYLELAREKMNARYLGKTMDSFKKYTALISDEHGDFGMDTNFVLTRREGGQSRPKNAYSKGTRELYELALRLSLADSLYENELPFIILDDPFAYFDDTKLERAKEMLGTLSEKKQIIYLTPSENRCVNS